MPGYRPFWESPTGDVIHLSLDPDSDSGIWIAGYSGMEVDPEFATVAATNGRGVRLTALTIPAMEASLTLHLDPVAADLAGVNVADLWESISRAFPPTRQGRLVITQRNGDELYTPGYCNKPIAWPSSKSPYTPGIPSVEVEVGLLLNEGVWYGSPVKPEPAAGGYVAYHNPGDLDAYLELELLPGATARTFRVRDKPSVVLPTVTSARTMSLDPGDAFKITDPVTGALDQTAWTSLRGRTIPGRVPAGGTVEVLMSSTVNATLTPMYLSPWR